MGISYIVYVAIIIWAVLNAVSWTLVLLGVSPVIDGLWATLGFTVGVGWGIGLSVALFYKHPDD